VAAENETCLELYRTTKNVSYRWRGNRSGPFWTYTKAAPGYSCKTTPIVIFSGQLFFLRRRQSLLVRQLLRQRLYHGGLHRVRDYLLAKRHHQGTATCRHTRLDQTRLVTPNGDGKSTATCTAIVEVVGGRREDRQRESRHSRRHCWSTQTCSSPSLCAGRSWPPPSRCTMTGR
jgi:hypothetical protein